MNLPFDEVTQTQGFFLLPKHFRCCGCLVPVWQSAGFPGRVVWVRPHAEPVPHDDTLIEFYCRLCIGDLMRKAGALWRCCRNPNTVL